MTCELLTSSPEPVAASWPTSSLDTNQSSPSSGSPTPAKSCASSSPACESLRVMCEPWTSRESWLASMRSALDFLVRTSALQERAQALEASAAAFIEKSCEQLTLFDLPGSSSKTAHSSEPEAGTSSSPTWWRVDTPGETDSLPRLMSERPTSAIGGGALLPTLTVCGNYNRKGASPTSGDGLATAIGRLLPTLVARDYRHPGRSRLERTGQKCGEVLPQVLGGPLNPRWCEGFMGWPIGHTELKHWATAKSRCKPRLHGLHLAARTTSEVSA
jgi:hypothetical protein